jgi:hypothetical protein
MHSAGTESSANCHGSYLAKHATNLNQAAWEAGRYNAVAPSSSHFKWLM